MARLDLHVEESRRVATVTLSRRNLLTLLHKLDMPGSARTITNSDCWLNGTLDRGLTLVLRCEDDAEHYSKRPDPPGPMHPASEAFIRREGGWTRGGEG
jgi:hypothetical protein